MTTFLAAFTTFLCVYIYALVLILLYLQNPETPHE